MDNKPSEEASPYKTKGFYMLVVALTPLSLICFFSGYLTYSWDFWSRYLGLTSAGGVFLLTVLTIAALIALFSLFLVSVFSFHPSRPKTALWPSISFSLFIALNCFMYFSVNRSFNFYILAIDQDGQRARYPFDVYVANSGRYIGMASYDIVPGWKQPMKRLRTCVNYDEQCLGHLDTSDTLGEMIFLEELDGDTYVFPDKYVRIEHRQLKGNFGSKEHPVIIRVLKAPMTELVEYRDTKATIHDAHDVSFDLYAGSEASSDDMAKDITLHLSKSTSTGSSWTLTISTENEGVQWAPKGDMGFYAPNASYSKNISIDLTRYSRPDWTYYLIKDGPKGFYFRDQKIFAYLSIYCMIDYKKGHSPVEVSYVLEGRANTCGGRSLRSSFGNHLRLPIQREDSK